MAYFTRNERAELLQMFKKDIENTPRDNISKKSLDIMMKAVDAGFTKEQVTELRETYKKRLLSVV